MSRYFWFLKHVPGLPQAFDGVLLLWSFIFQHQVVRRIEEIKQLARSFDRVTVHLHRYGGLEFRYQREFAHIHGNGVLDILLPSALQASALHCKPHHTLPNSRWVSLRLNNESTFESASQLLREVYESLKIPGPKSGSCIGHAPRSNI